ncbi:MAG: tetratricopeptide repeat protein [Elusimicrobia bacterium]|nr:tetratricopeptide repeat protein [Elusimicrobiota bacterium]
MKRFYVLFLISNFLFLISISSFASQPDPLRQPNIEAGNEASAYYYYLLGNIAEIKGDLKNAIKEYKYSTSYDADSLYVKKQLANLYILTGDIKSAYDIVSKILKTQPDDKSIIELMAEISVYQKKPEEAVSFYERILSTEPANKNALYNLGVLYSDLKKYEKAILYFEKYLQIVPESPEIYVNIGILYQKLNSPVESELYLKKAQEMDANSIVPLVALANMYEEKKDYKKALELYDKLLKVFPDDLELMLKTVVIYILEGDLISAKKYLEEAKKVFPKNYLIDYYYGLIAIDEKDYQGAMDYFNESIKLNKKFPEPHIQKGYLFALQENEKQSIKSYEKAIELGSDVAGVYFLLALNYETLNNFKKAETYLKKAINLEPDNLKFHFELVIVLDKLKKSAQVEQELFKLIEIDSTSALAYNYLGYTWADRNIRLEEAEKYIKIALATESENPAYLDSLGWVYYRQKKYDESQLLLEKASKIIDDPLIYEHLGDCYLALDNVQMAVDSWETSLLLEKNKSVKDKIKKYGKNIKWSNDMIKMRAIKCFKDMHDILGFMSINTVHKNEVFGLNGPFFFKKPKQFRLEILGFFSVPQGIILMRQGTIVYITPEKKVYNLTDEYFWVKDIFNIFESEYFDGLNFVSEEKDTCIFKNNFVELKINKKLQTISEIIFLNGSIVKFSDFKLAGKVIFPHKLDFINTSFDMKATVILKKLNLNKNIKIDLFNVPEE